VVQPYIFLRLASSSFRAITGARKLKCLLTSRRSVGAREIGKLGTTVKYRYFLSTGDLSASEEQDESPIVESLTTETITLSFKIPRFQDTHSTGLVGRPCSSTKLDGSDEERQRPFYVLYWPWKHFSLGCTSDLILLSFNEATKAE
jgi:hypothetical protein